MAATAYLVGPLLRLHCQITGLVYDYWGSEVDDHKYNKNSKTINKIMPVN